MINLFYKITLRKFQADKFNVNLPKMNITNRIHLFIDRSFVTLKKTIANRKYTIFLCLNSEK